MKIDEVEAARLRKALAGAPAFAEASAGPECPPPEEIWEAVHGRLPPERIAGLLDHTLECPACSMEWRLALEMSRERAKPSVIPSSVWGSRTFLALAAVVVLMVIGWQTKDLWRPAPPEYRNGGGLRLESPVDGLSLPREDFALRWEGGPEGCKYDLLVTTETLDVVAQASGLSESHYLVPFANLLEIPAGSRLLWKLQVVLPDGSRVDVGRTFVTILR